MAHPIIDLHSHWFAPAAIEHLSRRGTAPRIVAEDSGGRAIETALGHLLLGPQWWDIDHRLAHLDRHNVVHQLLSWPTTLNLEPLIGFAEGQAFWRLVNDGFGKVVRCHPGRFSALAVLSSERPEWSAAELRRAHEELGLIGFVLPVNAFGSVAGVRHLAPLLREAQRLRSHLYLHTGYAAPAVPGQPHPVERPESASLAWTLGAMHHFASAFATVALTDALDEYPDVTVQVAMLAGAGAGGLLAEQASITPERFGGPPDPARLSRLWLDTGAIGQGPAAIRATVETLGIERVVFGSDYAPAADIGAVLEHVTQGVGNDEARCAILFANGRALLARHGRQVDEPASIMGSSHVRI